MPTYATRVDGVWYSNEDWLWEFVVLYSFLSRNYLWHAIAAHGKWTEIQSIDT